MVLLTEMNSLDVGTGAPQQDMKSTRDKTNIGNPKVNRLSPTHSQTHLSRLSVKFTWTFSTMYSPGVYHTEGFNAMTIW